MVLVIPGVLPTAADLHLFKELITLDLPTFGNPTTPT